MAGGNFTFLDAQFSSLADSAKRAERHIHPDPRAACFYARFSLEVAVQWLYANDRSLRMPYDQSLGALIHEPCFQKLVPEAAFQKARVIQKAGNLAVHSQRPIRQYDALQVVKELHHFLFWLHRTYSSQPLVVVAAFEPEAVPRPTTAPQPLDDKKIAALEAELAEQGRKLAERDRQVSELDQQLRALQETLAAARAVNESVPDTHDYTEADTRRYLIDLNLRLSGWTLDQARDREFEVAGMPNAQGKGYADYVLWGDDGKPLGVLEAKKTTVHPMVGQQQAKLYADCLYQMTGQRPVIFYTNGYETWMWDDLFYPPRRVAGFYHKEDLQRVVQRRVIRKDINVAQLSGTIVERYYQKRAIGSLCASFTAHQRKGLLVMATGTGKTRMAIALVDLLQRMNWVKRVLFLADRVSLVNQAANAFKKFLPDSSPVNLVTEKDKEGRVYVCTYPTMMGLIDEADEGASKFGVGHFDLVIIDEAHRSVYQKYRAIFEYFDSLLIGLTATPRDQVDKNTYELFDLEPGVPTDAYELEEAVKDGYLVPPKVEQVDLKFPREGIRYDELSDEEKEEWESLDWGDEAAPVPQVVNASAVNHWLFNTDTVDKVLKHLMERGHRVHGGDRLGKTIIFARNHEHAKFIEQRFNTHYPHYAGHFARIIDNQAKYPQSLIDDFSQKEKEPHIAISVDMMDTGIDVPEVVNLLFFKPVYSKIKFWQMIGRGTRLCPDLFGPGQDKENFRVFDFCFNFDYFRENPDGIDSGGSESLSTRLFKSRVQLLTALQREPELEASGDLTASLADTLHGEVQAMNPENFIVRMRLQAVEPYQKREAWNQLSEGDVHTLVRDVAGLPSRVEADELEARLFDMTSLRLQLALVEGERNKFEATRQQVVEIAALLEEKDGIPAVRVHLAYLQGLQEPAFWEDITLALLEKMRLIMRGLVQFIDRKRRIIVYTHFQDEVQMIRQGEVIVAPRMTSLQYEKKVREFLSAHLDHIAVHKLRLNEPLTATDLQELEQMLVAIGQENGRDLLTGVLQRTESPSLVHFVRRLVGMDRGAAQQAFSKFLTDHQLSPAQIRFVELVIVQLTSRGIMEESALYEPPFSDFNDGGPEAVFAGKEAVVEGIFSALRKTAPRMGAVG